jgi:hypothetical protein
MPSGIEASGLRAKREPMRIIQHVLRSLSIDAIVGDQRCDGVFNAVPLEIEVLFQGV